MKVYTSYFYKIRFFTSHIVPLSTAVWDPKWYHFNHDQKYVWKDKNGVYNGLRYEKFMPVIQDDGQCHGPENCSSLPTNCNFLRHYYDQISQLDFNEVINELAEISQIVKRQENLFNDPSIALIFHETPLNPCSERVVITRWFNEHDYPIEEF